jgi:hypothetical protein
MTSYNPGKRVRSPGPKIPEGRRAQVASVVEFAAKTSFSASTLFVGEHQNEGGRCYLGGIVGINVPSSIGRFLICIYEIPPVVDNAGTACVDQCLDASFSASLDDIAGALNVDAEEQLFISFSNRGDRRAGGMDDDGRPDSLEGIDESGLVGDVGADVRMRQRSLRRNVEERDFALGVPGRKQRRNGAAKKAIGPHDEHSGNRGRFLRLLLCSHVLDEAWERRQESGTSERVHKKTRRWADQVAVGK